MATFLDGLNEWNAKSAVVIKDLVLRGDFETASLLSSLRTTANDESLQQYVRLNALTALINRGELLDIPVPPYYPVAFSFTPTQTYVGLHNDLSGLNTGDYWHLTYAQYLSVLNKASIADITFGNLTGDVNDSTALFDAFNLKQDVIAGGDAGQFFSWDGTMRFVSWTNLTNKPTTLAGLGINAADTLFDGRYLSQSSILTSYTLGSNAAVLNTDSLVGAIGKLQAQVNSVASSTGTINSVGLTMDPTVFSVANSPLTGAGGTINVTLQSQAAKTFLASPNAGSGTPSFRQIVVADLPTSGVSAGTYGNTTNWPTFTVDIYGRITSIATQAATSGGTVTSVGLSAPVEFVVSNSPVTTTGTLGLSWQTQTANYVLAGPPSGVAAAPSFRALVAADIPNIDISKVNGLYEELDFYLPNALANSAMFIGNGSDAAVNATVTGDLELLYVNNNPTNEAEFTIQPGVVSYAKIQDVSGQKLLGRYALADGPAQEITFDSLAFTLNSTTGVLGLVTPNPPTLTAKGDLITATGPSTQVRLGIGANATLFMADSAVSTGNKWVAMSGDATIATSGALTIASGAVTLGKMATLAANSFIGNNTGSAITPIALDMTQATAMLNQFTSSLKGLVPASGGGTVNFLRADGSWTSPSGSGTVTSANQYSIPYYSVSPSGTTVIGLTPQTTNGVYFLRANVTLSAAVAPSWIGSTGSGDVVLATGPTLATPTLGVASATSINKVAITAPATSATLTLADGSTLATSGAFSTTLTATAATTLTLPTTGTLATLGGTETFTNKTLNGPKIGTAAGSGHFHMHYANSVPTGLADYITVFGDTSPTKKLGFLFETDAFESYFQFDATAASKTYTFPDATGTVALINASNYLSVPKNGAVSGGIIFDGGTSGTISLEAPLVAGTQSYIFPSAYPAAASGYYLTSDASGTLSWVAVTGGGDVTGPSGGVTDGDFSVFDGTTGKIIKKSAGASLSATGAAVFNSSVTVGVSGVAPTGELIFRNASTAVTTTFQSSTSQATSASYVWPQAQATSAGLVLTNDGAGNLSWTATGTGNVTLAGTNAFTGANSFANTTSFSNQVTINGNFTGGTFRIQNGSGTGFTQLVSASASGTTRVFTFPDIATATVAVSNFGQTFTGVQQFNGGLTVNSNGLGAASVLKIQHGGAAGYTTISTANTADTAVTFPSGANGTLAFQNLGQIFTGVQQFNGGLTIQSNGLGAAAVLKIQHGGAAGYTTISTANTSNGIVTFPSASGTVALIGLAQNWPQLQTFQAGISLTTGGTFATAAAVASTFSGSVTMNFAGGATTPQLTISGGTHNFINLSGATGIPSTPTRSAGTKIVLFSNPGGIDAALGVAGSGELWNSTSVSFGWYCNTITASLNLTVSALTLTSLSLIGSATQNVFNTVSTTVNFAGVATALTIASGVTAAQTVNMFTGSTGASTYNFATGATASATTKAINIGTGGTSGSTTNITFGTATTTNLRFFGSANTSGKPTVTGSRGSNAALASFLTAMSNLGLITDSTTA